MSSAELAPGRRPTSGRLAEAAGWLALAALLVVFVPPFLCMPLTSDGAFYSVCARHILRGGALEKDFLFLPPPGMPWAVALVRLTLGESSVALRLADLLIVAASVGLLARWLAALGLSRAVRVWAAVLMFAFYLTTTELCHCQPDSWMLPPALCALHLRRLRLTTGRYGWGWSVAEGLCWGAACLVKPFVAVPAALAWLVGAAALRRSGAGWPGRLLADAGGVLAGGLLAAGVWQLWLASSGSWAAYWHNAAEMRGDYYAETRPWTERLGFIFIDLAPWSFLHVLALPLAAANVGSVLLRAASPRLAAPGARAVAFALLSALYLGWMVQANFIQTQFNYHLVPTILLALALAAGLLGRQASLRGGWVVLVVFGAAAVVWQPAASPRRLAAWLRCWREGNSAALHDLLTLDDRDREYRADEQDLDKVAEYLRSQDAREGELLCFNLSTQHLYLWLGVDPPTRYLIPQTHAKFFPLHRAAILAEVRASGARYVVTDMMATGLRHAQALAERPGDPLALPPDISPSAAAEWPYAERVVFRAGRYYVHQAP